jgi:LPXTG-site transpeptidase (sortase) family protein
MKKFKIDKKRFIKAAVTLLEATAVVLVLYLIALPFLPSIKYQLDYNKEKLSPVDYKDEELVKVQTVQEVTGLPETEYLESPDRVIIPKIGVNAPIIASQSAAYGLSKGSWLVPNTSTPDKGGNTVITGHRFKYLPPNNLTFYLFDKLETGDMFSVMWHDKAYYYRIKEVKIVDKTEISILNQTNEPVVTMFTCHPIYSTEQRLVVVGELINDDQAS